MTAYGLLIRYAQRHQRSLALISLLTVCASLTTLALPWFAGRMLAIIVAGSGVEIETTVTLLVGGLVISTVLGAVAAIVSSAASGRILADLQQQAYQWVQRLPTGFHDNSGQGDVLALMTYEVANLSRFLTSTLAQLPSMFLTAAGATVLLFVLDPALAAIVPILIPAFYLVLRLVGRNLRQIARKSQEAAARLMFLGEAHLEILPATKSFAVEEQQASVYAQAVDEARQLTLAHDRIAALLGPTVALVTALVAIGVLVFSRGNTSLLDDDPQRLFSFLLYAALLTRPVGSLAEVYGRFQIARGTLARLGDVFAQPAEPGYAQTAPLVVEQGSIEFRQIHFAYPGRPPVLQAADLTIGGGEIVAITGENGSGKSTALNLLLRFYDPGAGCILIDGQDITTVDVRSLRRQVGYVPQHALLFNGTVRENVLFARADAGEAALRRALDLAQASEFIASLPEGLETRIGDHGVRLSGGQRQRIALARALLADPPILILDEATSMYDLAGESAFVEACSSALVDKTVLIVTHRSASLALADRVVVVEDGKIRAARSGGCDGNPA